jgi:hypothetical protein
VKVPKKEKCTVFYLPIKFFNCCQGNLRHFTECITSKKSPWTCALAMLILILDEVMDSFSGGKEVLGGWKYLLAEKV